MQLGGLGADVDTQRSFVATFIPERQANRIDPSRRVARLMNIADQVKQPAEANRAVLRGRDIGGSARISGSTGFRVFNTQRDLLQDVELLLDWFADCQVGL